MEEEDEEEDKEKEDEVEVESLAVVGVHAVLWSSSKEG